MTKCCADDFDRKNWGIYFLCTGTSQQVLSKKAEATIKGKIVRDRGHMRRIHKLF